MRPFAAVLLFGDIKETLLIENENRAQELVFPGTYKTPVHMRAIACLCILVGIVSGLSWHLDNHGVSCSGKASRRTDNICKLDTFTGLPQLELQTAGKQVVAEDTPKESAGLGEHAGGNQRQKKENERAAKAKQNLQSSFATAFYKMCADSQNVSLGPDATIPARGIWDAAWARVASEHLVPAIKGTMRPMAGTVAIRPNVTYADASMKHTGRGDGLRADAQIIVQTEQDINRQTLNDRARWRAPAGIRSQPRAEPFASVTQNGTAIYFVAGESLRRINSETGKVETLLNLLEVAGMEPFPSEARLRELWPKQPPSGEGAAWNVFQAAWNRRSKEVKDEQYSCGTPDEFRESSSKGRGRKICTNGLPANTVSNIMLAGVNYQEHDEARSVLYVMLFEQRHGPLVYGDQPRTKDDYYGRGPPSFAWISDVPSKLLEIDVSSDAPAPRQVPLFAGTEANLFSSKELNSGAHAVSMAATFVPKTTKVHLFLAFSYPDLTRPTASLYRRNTRTNQFLSRYENPVLAESAISGNGW